MDPQVMIDRLREILPPIFTRKFVCAHLGGYISAGHLANLDSAKMGPGGIRVGKVVLYERESFLEWLYQRLTATKAQVC